MLTQVLCTKTTNQLWLRKYNLLNDQILANMIAYYDQWDAQPLLIYIIYV